MTDYTRFGVYYLPPAGAFADFGAAWLGWDVLTGVDVPHFDVPSLAEFTATPRKYGFHGTLKPPFVLAEGHNADMLITAVSALANTQPPATCTGLEIAKLGAFLAFRPIGDAPELDALAAACVTQLDAFRAAPSEAELERRRKRRLSPAQENMLIHWGYPYVLDQFRFHMTLTGRLTSDALGIAFDAATTLAPVLPQPYTFRDIALVGERPDKRFELLQRFSLTGAQ